MNTEPPTSEEIDLGVDYLIARIDAAQPRPDTRLFIELGRLIYLKTRLEQSNE